MVKPNTLNTRKLQIILPALCFLIFAGLLYFQYSTGPVNVFNLRFNAYALISFISCAANLSFLVYVTSKREEFKSQEITWYVLFLCAMVLYGLFEGLQRLSGSPDAAIFWAALSGIGPSFIGVGLLLFSLQYTKPDVKLNLTIPVLVLTAAVMFYFFGSGDLFFINSTDATRSFSWGYNNDIGKAFVMDLAWALGLSFIALGVMARFKKKTQNLVLKKQATLFIIAISTPVAGALIFDGVVPAIGLHIPPLGNVFTVITAAIMLYALNKYRLFSVTPASMSVDILSTMSESVIVTDEKLQIQLMNDSATTLFKKYNLDSLNSSLIDFFNEEEAKRISGEVSKISSVGSKHTLGNFVFGDDTYLRIAAVKITEEHGVEGYIFAIADVTELQHSYSALQEEKRSVDKKVEERTKELKEAQGKLAETDKIKTEFVILTSHNLRTPLTALKGNLEFLEDSKLTADQKKFLSSLQDSTKKLDALIEELLTISEIEAGDKGEFRSVKLSEIVEALKDEGEELAKKTGNKFSLVDEAGSVQIKANPARLITALHNVLDNAFKFTKEGEVMLSIDKNEEGVTIKVKDNGVGISDEELPKLFTKFHRGTDYMRYDYEGEGIGLYLSKLIIDEHGGKISAQSQKGKGAEFTINLPI